MYYAYFSANGIHHTDRRNIATQTKQIPTVQYTHIYIVYIYIYSADCAFENSSTLLLNVQTLSTTLQLNETKLNIIKTVTLSL